MNADAALERIRQVADSAPQAVLLARLASLATRIEPILLRRLRIELLPEADVSAEADLWFSALIDSAGSDAVELDPAVAEILRTDLARDQALLESAAGITREAHAHLPPALRLEEEVTALGLSGADDAADRIEAALATALRALTGDAARAKETARWFARAWPRLPDTVRRTRGAATLALAAGLLAGRRGRSAPVDANAGIDDVRWVFRDQSFTGFDNVDAFLEGDTVVFTEAAESGGMRVPRTDPRVVELSFDEVDGHEPLLVDASPGTAVSVPPAVARLTLTTLAGDVYELERVAAQSGGEAVEQWPDEEAPWVDISPYREFADACVMITAGVTAYRVARTGFRPTTGHVVTAREPLVFEEMLVVEPAAFGSRPRPRPDVQGPLLVIESDGPNAIDYATAPFSIEVDDADSLDTPPVRPKDAIILGHDGSELRAARGQAYIMEPLAHEFRVAVHSTYSLPDEFEGGPVIINDAVRGIVTSIEPSDGEEGTWILVVASGLAIREAIDGASAARAQHETAPETGPATGNRVAKIVIVGREPWLAAEAVRSLSDRVVGTREMRRKGVSWNVGVRNAPDLRAGLVFWAARPEPEWPLVLDLRDAALALIVDEPSAQLKKGGEGDDGWAESIRATIEKAAPHVRVVSSTELPAITANPPPARESARNVLLPMIDWSAQPELDADAWESAPRLAFQPPVSGPVGHAREWSSQVGGRDAKIDRWLGVITGARIVESSDIVFRDPEWFEDIVIETVRVIQEEQKTRAIPGIDLLSAERILSAERLMVESRLPVAKQEVVHAVASALRDAGVAVLISTDYGTVIVMPALALDGRGFHRAADGHRVMSASWTGDGRTGFFAVVAAFEWSDGRVEDVGWDSTIGEGVAWVERDGRYRIGVRQNGIIADLVVTEAADSSSGYPDRPRRTIRSALEEALADNRSLEVREERMLA